MEYSFAIENDVKSVDNDHAGIVMKVKLKTP